MIIASSFSILSYAHWNTVYHRHAMAALRPLQPRTISVIAETCVRAARIQVHGKAHADDQLLDFGRRRKGGAEFFVSRRLTCSHIELLTSVDHRHVKAAQRPRNMEILLTSQLTPRTPNCSNSMDLIPWVP